MTQRRPGWITSPPSWTTRAVASSRSSTSKYGSDTRSPGAHDLEGVLEPLAVPRLVQPPARARRVGQRHGDRVADREAQAHAFEAALAEQAPDGEPADREDQARAEEAQLPLAPEGAQVLL